MDKEIFNLIKKEEARQKKQINLIASENFVSRDVLKALGSILTNKYSEGYAGKRYYAGNEFIDKIEMLCIKRALKLFGLSENKWSVNVQPYSGSPANLAVYAALVPLGEKIMGMRLDMGGHLTHGHSVSFTGKAWTQVPYGVSSETETINYDELIEIVMREKPKMIIAGASAYSRIIDFEKFREIADSCGAYLMVDMAHIAGLVAGGVHPSPFHDVGRREMLADIVTTTTHKTLRGPRGAMIFCRKELAEKIDKAVFPGLQGGPHNHQTAGIAVALKEAMSRDFKNYAKQVVKNAKVFAEELKKAGFHIVSGGTDNHLFIVDTWADGKGISGKEAQDRLEKQGIIVSRSTIPYDTRKPYDPSGIRLGTPTITTSGFKEKDIKTLAKRIIDILK